MITFDEVYAFTKGLPGIYTETELHELYKLVAELPDNATIVEIGVLYGRSASIYFQVAKAGKPLDIHLIDPWVVNESDAYMAFHGMIDKHFRDLPFTMHNRNSRGLDPYRITQRGHYPGLNGTLKGTIDLLHIDGDHSPEGIREDCTKWLGAVCSGTRGIAVFHDYNTRELERDGGHLVFPQIKETVDAYCAGWEPLGVHDSQAKFRRK